MKWLRKAAPALLVVLVGCGSEEGSVTLVPVTGTITMNNKPLADAHVMFLPNSGNTSNTPGEDVTGPDGNYRLKFKTRTGVSPGKYKVSITPSIMGETAVPDEFKKDAVAYQMRLTAAKGNSKAAQKAAPVGTKNEFETEVAAEGGAFDFDLKASSAAKK